MARKTYTSGNRTIVSYNGTYYEIVPCIRTKGAGCIPITDTAGKFKEIDFKINSCENSPVITFNSRSSSKKCLAIYYVKFPMPAECNLSNSITLQGSTYKNGLYLFPYDLSNIPKVGFSLTAFYYRKMYEYALQQDQNIYENGTSNFIYTHNISSNNATAYEGWYINGVGIAYGTLSSTSWLGSYAPTFASCFQCIFGWNDANHTPAANLDAEVYKAISKTGSYEYLPARRISDGVLGLFCQSNGQFYRGYGELYAEPGSLYDKYLFYFPFKTDTNNYTKEWFGAGLVSCSIQDGSLLCPKGTSSTQSAVIAYKDGGYFSLGNFNLYPKHIFEMDIYSLGGSNYTNIFDWGIQDNSSQKGGYGIQYAGGWKFSATGGTSASITVPSNCWAHLKVTVNYPSARLEIYDNSTVYTDVTITLKTSCTVDGSWGQVSALVGGYKWKNRGFNGYVKNVSCILLQ